MLAGSGGGGIPAAESLLEGLAETFTINRLNLSPALRRCLGTTDLIENPHSAARRCTGRVTNWQDGGVVLRWAASRTRQNSRRGPRTGNSGSRWQSLGAQPGVGCWQYQGNSGAWAPNRRTILSAGAEDRANDTLFVADCLPADRLPFSPEGNHFTDCRLALGESLMPGQ